MIIDSSKQKFYHEFAMNQSKIYIFAKNYVLRL